jgi:hypothetical protein
MHPPPPQFGSAAYLNHHGVKPAMLQSTLGERMRTAALAEIEPALVAVESWARNGVLAHLKSPSADRVQAANDCSSVAALVCAAALVSRVDAVHVENTRRCLFNEGDIADMVSRFENVVQLEPRQLNDLLRVFMRRLSDVVCAWPGVDLTAFEPLEGTYVALSDDAELVGDSWVISADSGSLTPLCPSTPAARAMRSTLEAIELAVERVLTAAWLSSAAAAGAGRRGGDPWAHGDVFVNDDATIRENDALRNAFSTGAMAAPLKTLVTAAGAIDAAARILRADALDPSKFDLPAELRVKVAPCRMSRARCRCWCGAFGPRCRGWWMRIPPRCAHRARSSSSSATHTACPSRLSLSGCSGRFGRSTRRTRRHPPYSAESLKLKSAGATPRVTFTTSSTGCTGAPRLRCREDSGGCPGARRRRRTAGDSGS